MSQQQDVVYVSESVPIMNPRQEARLAIDEISPYSKVLDVLTSHLLNLQARDAWCRRATWKASLENIVKEGNIKGKWYKDDASLVRCNSAIYIPNNPATH
jgi:hypothetical protein